VTKIFFCDGNYFLEVKETEINPLNNFVHFQASKWTMLWNIHLDKQKLTVYWITIIINSFSIFELSAILLLLLICHLRTFIDVVSTNALAAKLEAGLKSPMTRIMTPIFVTSDYNCIPVLVCICKMCNVNCQW